MDSSSYSETSIESSSDCDSDDAQFSCELTAEKPVYTFTVDEEENAEFKTKLDLDFATIADDVKDEYNVVEVTTCDENGEEVTKTLAILRRSGECNVSLEHILDPPITFRLRAGSGPVKITGKLIVELRDQMCYKHNEE